MYCRITSEPILFIYAFNFASWTALIPLVILHKSCIQKYSLSSNICKSLSNYPTQQTEIQKESSYWQMIFFLTVNILSLFSILIIGPLTDVIGRKKGFLFISIVMTCMNGVIILNIFYESSSIGYMIFCAVLLGLFGDISGVILLCYSDMADVTETDKKSRTFKMGILESGLFLGMFFGGICSGYLLQNYGFETVPKLNLVLAILLLLYCIIVLPSQRHMSTNKKENESCKETTKVLSSSNEKCSDCDDKETNDRSINFNEFDMSLLNPWFHLKCVLNVFLSKPISNILLFALFMGYFLQRLVVSGDQYVLVLYLKNAPFNMSASTIGILIAVHGLVGFLGAILGGIASYCFKVRDDIILIIGLIGLFCSFFCLGLARSLTLVIVSRVVGLTHPIVSSAFRSYTTKICGVSNKHGSILSALQYLDVLSAMLSIFFVLGVYRGTLVIYSGIVFYMLAGLSVISLCLVVVLSLKIKLK